MLPDDPIVDLPAEMPGFIFWKCRAKNHDQDFYVLSIGVKQSTITPCDAFPSKELTVRTRDLHDFQVVNPQAPEHDPRLTLLKGKPLCRIKGHKVGVYCILERRDRTTRVQSMTTKTWKPKLVLNALIEELPGAVATEWIPPPPTPIHEARAECDGEPEDSTSGI